jgi:hypothetical protein
VKGISTAMVLACTAASFANASTVDQQYVPSTPNSSFIVGGVDDAQTFTVGTTGQMTGIALDISRTGSANSALNVYVVQVQNGVPVETLSGASVLAYGAIFSTQVSASPSFVQAAFNPFNVTAGEQLAIVATERTDYAAFAWSGNFGDPAFFNAGTGTYAGGRMFIRNGSASGNSFGNAAMGMNWGDYPGHSLANGDFGFQTFVTAAAPVPLPASAWLLLSSLGGFVGMVRKRRAAPIALPSLSLVH